MTIKAKPKSASLSLRVFARLLSYPDAELREFLPEMRDILHSEAAVTHDRLDELDALIEWLIDTDALETEANYVQLFDHGRATSLHLFEHVHGDSRDRGPAIIDLGQTYESSGLYLEPGELPDYLPAVLEFVSTQPPAEAKAFLSEMAHIFNVIFNALQQGQSPYASIIRSLLELAGEKVQAVKLAAEVPLDSAWEEPVVFDGCSSKGQAKPDQPQPINIIPKDNSSKGATL